MSSRNLTMIGGLMSPSKPWKPSLLGFILFFFFFALTLYFCALFSPLWLLYLWFHAKGTPNLDWQLCYRNGEPLFVQLVHNVHSSILLNWFYSIFWSVCFFLLSCISNHYLYFLVVYILKIIHFSGCNFRLPWRKFGNKNG